MKDEKYFQDLFDRVWAVMDELEKLKRVDPPEDIELESMIRDCNSYLLRGGQCIVNLSDFLGYSLRDAAEHLYGEDGLYGPLAKKELDIMKETDGNDTIN